MGRSSVAVGRMIVAYSRGDGAATNYEIARVTAALQHPRAGDDSGTRIDPVHRWLQTPWSRRAQPGYVAIPASLLAFGSCQAAFGVVRLERGSDLIPPFGPQCWQV